VGWGEENEKEGQAFNRHNLGTPGKEPDNTPIGVQDKRTKKRGKIKRRSGGLVFFFSKRGKGHYPYSEKAF